MSSAYIWILVPTLVGTALLILRLPWTLSLVIAVSTTLFLTWAAWQLPIDQVLPLGPASLEIAPSLLIFGRNFTLDALDKPLLTFIYSMATWWLLGFFFAKPSRIFIPLSLIIVALFVSALSVDPFLYAALILGMVVLISIPMLVRPGHQSGPGVLRFLTFQMLAIPFILFTGWLLSGVEASPGNFNLVLRSGVLLAFGFMFLLALFPFHSWMPMLAERSHPYTFTFLAFFLPNVGILFGLSFLDRYAWLRDSAFVYELMLGAGSLAAVLGGVWAATQRDLGRALAFGVVSSIGSGLQAIALAGGAGLQTFFALLLPNAFVFWVWAVALSAFWNLSDGKMRLEQVRTHFRKNPFFFAVLVLSIFSIAGVPLLAGFPAHLQIWQGAAEASPWAGGASLLGSLGLLAAGARLLLAFFAQSARQPTQFGDEVPRKAVELDDIQNPYNWAFFGVTAIGMLGFGLLSRFFLSSVPALAAMYPQLFP
jgi:formate hydrogenlyase subunit 3/multisubunit Na+/H+ antiporter MnhD subunit